MPQPANNSPCNTTLEINSQPRLWQLLADEIYPELCEIREWVQQLANSGDFTEIWFTGAGTSAFVGDILAKALNVTTKLKMIAVSSTDLVSTPQLYISPSSNPLVVSFGRSGNSSESIGVLELLDQLLPTAPRLNITCNADSELAKRTHDSARQQVLILPAHDQGFAMTASFSSMLLSAAAIFDPATDDARIILGALSEQSQSILANVESWVKQQSLPSRMVFLGSGCLTYAAREAALKVMELTAGKIPSLWDSPLGFRHGPKSFISDNTHIILFESSNAYTSLYDQDLATEIHNQFPDNPLTVISNSQSAGLHVCPELPDHWNSVLFLLVAQKLAVDLSERLDLNVDDPFVGTNTLTRVVAGVKLHRLKQS